jgi:3-dehydroquinate synthase
MTATTIRVDLADRAYDVHIDANLLSRAGALIDPLAVRKRVAIIADATAWHLHGATFTASLESCGISSDVIIVPPGEASKSFESFQSVVEALLALNVERTDLIVAFGGGVTGDLAGFAAGVTKRGLDFIQVPTTLLAQVDSSVGGKTAINAKAGKNLVGLFWQPRLVLADLDVLSTLPAREMRAGWAEIVKYGLINDPDFFNWCAEFSACALGGNKKALGEAVAHSVRAKAQIVAQDERESGVRALLNLGHTFGHAFEVCAGFDEAVLKHGEAVACGMSMAYRFSTELGLCPRADARAVEAVLEAADLAAFPNDLPGGPWESAALFEAMGHDKKNEGGALTLILTRGIGQAFVQKAADGAKVARFIQEDLNR